MKKIKLLIAEDEAILAWMLCQNLELSGYEVCAPVATGEAAVKAALDYSPDVILMDIRLAGVMDGIEAAERISAQTPIPIIFMTGYSDDNIRERADVLHPAAYLVKPVTPDQIVPVLSAIFEITSHATER
jgi:CheY-like chemotaxis protein